MRMEFVPSRFQASAATPRRGFLGVAIYDVRRSVTSPTAPQGGLPPELGPYRAVRELGAGGMGRVTLVEDRRWGDLRALKWVDPATATECVIRRHRREFEVLSGLSHPSILSVNDFGRLGGIQFFTAEYLPGSVLDLTGPSSPAIWIRPLLQALEFLHERGWVHGDLKPQHVVSRSNPGDLCLIDFGLAKAVDEPTDREVMGTVHYMPPERFQGAPLGAECDLYSIGVMLYELLAGRLPYRGPRKLDVIQSVLDGRYEPLASVRPDLPPRLTSVVGALLSPDPRERPRSVEDLRAVLQEVWPGDDWSDREDELCAYVVSEVPIVGKLELEGMETGPGSSGWRHALSGLEVPVVSVTTKKAIDLVTRRRELLSIARLAAFRDVELDAERFTVRGVVAALGAQDPAGVGADAELERAAARIDAVREARIAPEAAPWEEFLSRLEHSVSEPSLKFALLAEARALENPWVVALIDRASRCPGLPLTWVLLDTWGNVRVDVADALDGWRNRRLLRSIDLPEADPVSRRMWFERRFGQVGLPVGVEELLEGESRASLGRLELLLRGLIESGVVGRGRGGWFSRGPSAWKSAPDIGEHVALLTAIAAVEGVDAADIRTLSAVVGEPVSSLNGRLELLAQKRWIAWDHLSGAIVIRDATLRQSLRSRVSDVRWKELHAQAARWLQSTDYTESASQWERVVDHLGSSRDLDALWRACQLPRVDHLMADRPATAKAWAEIWRSSVRGASDLAWLLDLSGRLRFEVGPVAPPVERLPDGATPTLVARQALLAAAHEPNRERARDLVAAIRPLDRRDPLRHESLLMLLEMLTVEGSRPPRDLWLELERLRGHAGPRSLALETELRMSRARGNGHPAAARDHGRSGIEAMAGRRGDRAVAWRVYLVGRLQEESGNCAAAAIAYEEAAERFLPVGDYRGRVRALLRWACMRVAEQQSVPPRLWAEAKLWVERLGGASERSWWNELEPSGSESPVELDLA